MIYLFATLVLLIVYYAIIGYIGVENIPKLKISFEKNTANVQKQQPETFSETTTVAKPKLIQGSTYSITKAESTEMNETTLDQVLSDELTDSVFDGDWQVDETLDWHSYKSLANLEQQVEVLALQELDAKAINDQLDKFLYSSFDEDFA